LAVFKRLDRTRHLTAKQQDQALERKKKKSKIHENLVGYSEKYKKKDIQCDNKHINASFEQYTSDTMAVAVPWKWGLISMITMGYDHAYP